MKMQACSACAGDYEDPDRTAGEEFEELLAETGDPSMKRWKSDRQIERIVPRLLRGKKKGKEQ